jgi:4-alpha-glucanotransferase
MLGILALDSIRHDAVIVGEDLGTVPPEVPPTLKQWGILGSSVLLFERNHDGSFRAAQDYEPLVLTTANTHDMATLAGFWRGRDIELRRQVGLLETDAQAAASWRARDRDRHLLLERLAAEGVLQGKAEDVSPNAVELRQGVHRFLCKTPSLLVGISLDDVAGEVEPVNIPGVGQDRYSSWTRRMHMPLEALYDSPTVDAVLGCI